ncbi:hypothetical protein VAE128_190004 [Vibrio aestuarianus]|nr:hypothetical protein VAE128_190004 [Vibrio aestuarianus]
MPIDAATEAMKTTLTLPRDITLLFENPLAIESAENKFKLNISNILS